MKKYRWWLIAGAVALLIGVFYVIGGIDQTDQAQSGSGATSSGPASVPRSSPGALSWSEEGDGADTAARNSAIKLTKAYRAVCAGDPRVEAAPYAGQTHPMVMLGPTNDVHGLDDWEAMVTLEDGFRDETDSSVPPALRPQNVDEVQLVACMTQDEVPTFSCGIYSRSDGTSGELLRTNGTTTVRVVAARTGAEIARRTFTGEASECPPQVGGAVGRGDPPWTLSGSPPFLHDVYAFLSGFPTGPAG
jgi:hypothetical protein